MKKVVVFVLFTCAWIISKAQVNFVKNPGLERFDTCPYLAGQIFLATNWQNVIQPNFDKGVEYFNSCSPSTAYVSCPQSYIAYQYPHTGKGFAGVQLYYDKTFPSPPSPLPIS